MACCSNFYGCSRVLLSLLLTGSVFIARAESAPHATRLVAEFSEKETALERALTRGDRAAARMLVDPDFELVAATDLGQSLSFDIMARESAQHPRTLTIREMSVREMGGAALVSFYWDEQDRLTRVPIRWMVVDAWKPEAGGWKLKTRYISAQGNPQINPPGYRPGDPVIEKRY